MECEVCGRQIIGTALNIIIDGAKLMVCSSCAHFSTRASQSLREERVDLKKATPAPRIPAPTPRLRRAPRTAENPIREDLELVENYSSLVRKAREALGLTHDELSRKAGAKISVLQKLETGKMVPDLNLAKRLENTLKIKLLQPIANVAVDEKLLITSSELTLGDIVSTKKREED